ncbi:hypothetical protein ENKNEFLB_02112 [Nocardioides aquaticus]|uniref:DUF4240 domain-containing protein n=1 Tax=Nocardioides aquaticus TaxID=160826 RepID=A0ABX8EGR8_9ACTN|nr:hypothetical protein [Nocardioides aquaticus]QVT79722.1 hypothetical protein ENKNEFLB_02112 [Nocardioides aquaticus]
MIESRKVSGRALIARLHILEMRQHRAQPWVPQMVEVVRRDLLGSYHDHELDAAYDNGTQLLDPLSPEDLEFVFDEGCHYSMTGQTSEELLTAALDDQDKRRQARSLLTVPEPGEVDEDEFWTLF